MKRIAPILCGIRGRREQRLWGASTSNTFGGAAVIVVAAAVVIIVVVIAATLDALHSYAIQSFNSIGNDNDNNEKNTKRQIVRKRRSYIYIYIYHCGICPMARGRAETEDAGRNFS